MSNKPKLLVAPCEYKAAKYAVEHWHYSGCMPAGKTVKFGVWENDSFIGVIIFSRGAAIHIGTPYGLLQNEVCELTRMALNNHKVFTSQILAKAIKLLKNTHSDMRLIVSFADMSQNHCGGIYQATNWIYECSKEYHVYLVKGKMVHPKTLHSKYGYGAQSLEWLQANLDIDAKRVKNGVKHKYLYPLDRAMRKQIEPLAQPYPKHAND